MTARPHRFLQYLQDQGERQVWLELPAESGGSAGTPRVVPTVSMVAPGGAARGIRQGVGLVTKQVVRLLYVSPILILVNLVLRWSRQELADLFTFAFVLLVVTFFVLLNLYIVLSVVVHFTSRGKERVVPPFEEADAFGRGLDDARGEVIRARGTIVGIGEPLASSAEVLRDLWSLTGAAPWRLVEAVDFAVVPSDGGEPVILHFQSAPMVVGDPERLPLERAFGRFSQGMHVVFDVEPATQGGLGRAEARYLSLTEGDEVEIVGRREGAIADVQRFELNGSIRSLAPAQRKADPYRGAGGGEGSLVLSTPDRPVWIRRG